jgi:hypothetical protein
MSDQYRTAHGLTSKYLDRRKEIILVGFAVAGWVAIVFNLISVKFEHSVEVRRRRVSLAGDANSDVLPVRLGVAGRLSLSRVGTRLDEDQ